ncbi:hypothetical protein OROGR_012072 [Orobanche gracilis]
MAPTTDRFFLFPGYPAVRQLRLGSPLLNSKFRTQSLLSIKLKASMDRRNPGNRRNWRNRRQINLYVGNSLEAKISVWFDYDNCIFPSGSNPEQLPYHIRKALNRMGYTSPMVIRPFIDVSFQDKRVAQGLRIARVESTHVPAERWRVCV